MSAPDPARVARAYLMTASRPGAGELVGLVAEQGPIMAAELTAATRGEVWEHAAHRLADAEAGGMRLVTPEDEEWPAQFSAPLPTDVEATQAALPLGLWARGGGRLDTLTARAVCVVGAVEATPYGERAAFTLGRELAAAGCTVLTSGRFGISGSAIRGALAARGPVLVLPPAPLSTTAPAGHRLLFGKVAWDGLMLTESAPGRPAPQNAAIRQAQLAAAFAAAVVLIEPRPRGLDRRLMHLATHAGRPLLAYPGPVHAPGSAYAHHLIRAERARLVASPLQVLTDLNWRSCADAREQG